MGSNCACNTGFKRQPGLLFLSQESKGSPYTLHSGQAGRWYCAGKQLHTQASHQDLAQNRDCFSSLKTARLPGDSAQLAEWQGLLCKTVQANSCTHKPLIKILYKSPSSNRGNVLDLKNAQTKPQTRTSRGTTGQTWPGPASQNAIRQDVS